MRVAQGRGFFHHGICGILGSVSGLISGRVNRGGLSINDIVFRFFGLGSEIYLVNLLSFKLPESLNRLYAKLSPSNLGKPFACIFDIVFDAIRTADIEYRLLALLTRSLL